MPNLFRSFLHKISQLQEAEKKRRYISGLKSSVTTSEPINFYMETKIFNLSSDPSKITLGKGSAIRGELLIFKNGGEITVGENSYVGENSRIWSANSIQIDDNVLISHGVNIMDNNGHELNHLERSASFKKLMDLGHPKSKINVLSEPIHIESYAWINFNAVIQKGVHVGKGAIVAPGSVVTSNVAPFTLVGGVPAREIRKLEDVE